MTDLRTTLETAHLTAGRALGQLSLALARGSVSGNLLRYVARSLREAADTLDELVGGE